MHRFSFGLRLSLALILSVLLLFASAGVASADPIGVPGTTLRVTWDVNYNPGTGRYIYSYDIINFGAAATAPARWTVAEDQFRGHAGLHHEVAFFNTDGGAFAYDAALPFFPAHNYDWSGLTLPAFATTTVGFEDVHGPTMAPFRVETAAGVAQSIQGLPLGAPVPALANMGQIVLDLGGGLFKGYALEGSVAVPVAGGWDYKYFLRNIGNVPIGPPPATNHADYYVNEHPTHAGIHHEAFNQIDNAYASGFGLDSGGHDGMGLPPGVGAHNYFWEGIGAGALGLWAPGQVLTLGFFDIHPPALVPWGGRVVGSSIDGFFSALAEQPPAPNPDALPFLTPEPSSVVLLSCGGLALLGAWRRRRKSEAAKLQKA